MKAGLFLGLWGVAWTAIVGMFDVLIGLGLIRQFVAYQYPTVVGRVTRSEVMRHSGSKGISTYEAWVEYTYRVGPDEYTGTRVRYGGFHSSDPTWARALVAAHPVGKEIPVHYNPKNPGDALLTPGLEGNDLWLLLFLTPFNAIMLVVWTAGGTAIWHHAAGGLPIRTTRGQTRVCLADYGPVTAGLVAVGLSAFVGTFVVVFGLGGFHPRLPVIQVVWAVVLGIGFTSAYWRWQNIRSGRYDLVLDESAGWLELPWKDRQGPGRRVPLTAAKRVRVETVEERRTKGGTTRLHYPVLQFRPGHGESVRLGTFYVQSRAERFANWLSRRLGLKGIRRGRDTEHTRIAGRDA